MAEQSLRMKTQNSAPLSKFLSPSLQGMTGEGTHNPQPKTGPTYRSCRVPFNQSKKNLVVT
jgi:hypothetical protein